MLLNYSSSLRAKPPAYLPPTDHVIPDIHHFPLILYHDPRWMQTNGSDFLSVCSLLASILFCLPTSIHPSPTVLSPTYCVHSNLAIYYSLSSTFLNLHLSLPMCIHWSLFYLAIHPSTHPPWPSLLYSLLFPAWPPPQSPAINTTDGQRESSPCHAAHCHIIFAGRL